MFFMNLIHSEKQHDVLFCRVTLPKNEHSETHHSCVGSFHKKVFHILPNKIVFYINLLAANLYMLNKIHL